MEEVMSFTGVSKAYPVNFTTLAYERLFNEYVPCQTGNEMDYKCFINFVLALENPTSEQSIKYFWKLLDLDFSGRLTPRKIKYFYEAIRSSFAGRYDTPSAEHIVVEVFDALGCNSEEGATLQDMIQSKQGQVVISLLLDVDGFWRYDNREHLNQMNSAVVEEEEEEEVAAEYYSSEKFDEFELQDRL
jgi:serine/threonine-protein phosphatase 2A regulatory subunit B''